MGFDPQFLDLMRTVATYLPFVANDGYGEPSSGTPVAFRCHVTYKRKIIRSDTDTDRVSTAQIQMPPGGYVVSGVATPTISIYDHVSLPFDEITRKVLDVTTFTDETSGIIHHQSIALE